MECIHGEQLQQLFLAKEAELNKFRDARGKLDLEVFQELKVKEVVIKKKELHVK